MTQSTLTYCYHLMHVCHNDTKYIDTLLSSYTCVSQWYKVHWHITVILYMCVTMKQNKLTHFYHLIHVCHNDTKYTDTLLSSYTCVSQWHKVHWHITIILYMCVTMTQNKLTHCYHLIHVCHNDTNYIDTLLSSYTCASQWHKVHWHITIILYMCVTMTQNKLTHSYHLIHVCHNDTKYTDTLLSYYSCVSQWHKIHWH
jgi:predicted small integral membrane protein